MARCPHGFERSVIPCLDCDGTAKPKPRAARVRRTGEPYKPGERPTHPGFKDLTGAVIDGGRVVDRAPNARDGSSVWNVELPCGHMLLIKGIALRDTRRKRKRLLCTECGGSRS